MEQRLEWGYSEKLNLASDLKGFKFGFSDIGTEVLMKISCGNDSIVNDKEKGSGMWKHRSVIVHFRCLLNNHGPLDWVRQPDNCSFLLAIVIKR